MKHTVLTGKIALSSIFLSLFIFFCGCPPKDLKQPSLAAASKPTASATTSQPQRTEPKISKEISKGALQTESGEASFEEMVAQVASDVEQKRFLAAAQWLEKIIRRYPDHQDIADFRFKHAECLLEGQKFLAANQAFDDFTRMYPGDEREQEAKFLSLNSLYNASKLLAVECDSTETDRVIKSCQTLLQDEGMQSKNVQINAILKHCQERLVNKDVAIFESYVRRNKLEAATARLNKIKSSYPDMAKELSPRIAYLECKLANAAHDDNKAREYLDMLEDKYADSKYTKMAASYVGNSNIINAVFG